MPYTYTSLELYMNVFVLYIDANKSYIMVYIWYKGVPQYVYIYNWEPKVYTTIYNCRDHALQLFTQGTLYINTSAYI